MNRPARPARLAATLAALLLVPAGAAAQTTSAVVVLNNPELRHVARADCLVPATDQDEIFITWTRTPTLNEEERAYISRTSTCSTETNNFLEELIPQRRRVTDKGTTIDHAKTVEALFALVTDETCGGVAGIDETVYLCVEFTGGALPTPVRNSASVRLDSKPPPTPRDVTVVPRENGLSVSWEMPTELDGTVRYRIYVTNPATSDVVTKEFEGAATRSGSVDGLENDVAYDVQVTSLDDAGSTLDNANESVKSVAVQGTPQPIEDFWERYKADGGTEQGGCASFGLTGLALLGLLALGRRRGALLGLGLFAVAGVAEAQPPIEVLHTPQRFSFELRAGPFEPNVDDEAGLTGTPYQDSFGEETSFLWRAELDFDLFRSFGRLGLGVGIGYWSISNSATLPDGSASEDEVRLTIIPITPLVYYRADFLYTRFGVPLVPYLKAGYGFARWNSEVNGQESTVDENGTLLGAQGWARGLELSGGLTFVLDVIEPDKAAALDQDFGINSTGLFVEASSIGWTGHTGLRLDGWTIAGGLLLAF